MDYKKIYLIRLSYDRKNYGKTGHTMKLNFFVVCKRQAYARLGDWNKSNEEFCELTEKWL